MDFDYLLVASVIVLPIRNEINCGDADNFGKKSVTFVALQLVIWSTTPQFVSDAYLNDVYSFFVVVIKCYVCVAGGAWLLSAVVGEI